MSLCADFKGILLVERGWPGHYICAARCVWRRNTLLTLPKGEVNGEVRVVVSSVGNQRDANERSVPVAGWVGMPINPPRWYETKVFMAREDDLGFWDADIGRQMRLPRELVTSLHRMHDRVDHDAEEMHSECCKYVMRRLMIYREKCFRRGLLRIARESKRRGPKAVLPMPPRMQ
jgi:hypothetical protein